MTAVATTAPAHAPAKIATQPEKIAALEKYLGGKIAKAEVLLAKVNGLTPAKFIQTVLFAASKNPTLLECTRQSLYLAALDASILGVPVGTASSLAYLIPYRNRDTKQLEATLQIDYKGLIALMLETGDVAKVELETVFEKDDFEAIVGAPRPHHRIFHRGPRGAAYGYYAVVTFKDGTTKWGYLGRDEVEQVRKQYADDNSPAWKKSYDEMGKKTAFKRLAKTMRRLGTGHEKLARAIEADNRAEAHEPHEPSMEVIEATGEVIEPAPKAIDAPADAPPQKTADRAKESVAAKAAEVAATKAPAGAVPNPQTAASAAVGA